MIKDTFQSHLAKAKGLGSTGEGTDHFIAQRVTAIALIPLLLWFCLSLAFLPQMDYQSLITWISSPIRAILLIILSLITFYHLELGLQVIIEDYISTYYLKLSSIVFMKMLCGFLAMASVFSILKISLSS